MKNLLNPWWVIGVVTIPHLILFTLFFSSYQIIKSLLTPENILYWENYGTALSVISLFSLLYAAFCWKNKRDLHTGFGLFILIAHGVFLYFFMQEYNSIIPSNIPNWMFMEGDLGLYVYTFLMPAMAYGLFLWVLYFTPNVYKTDIKLDFLMLFFIPLGCYFAVTAFPLWHYVAFWGELARHIITLLFMGGAVVFLFFLTRVFYVFIARQDNRFREMRLVWQIIFLIICPLLGLALNNGGFNFIFGDFSNPIVYVLAFCNGALLCVPAFENKYGRLLLFVLRSIGFSYIIYFFIVFLPFLPLAIPAMIVFGAGILMLMPLVNFIVQGYTLSEDFAYLRRSWNVFLLTPLFIGSLAVLPASFWLTCVEDKENLHTALAYLYEADYQKEAPKIKLASLKRTIENVAQTKQRRNNDMMLSEGKAQQPYLSAFYRWYVLDNLTLSDDKINHIGQIFLNGNILEARTPRAQVLTENAKLDSLWTETTYNQQDQFYTTWVHTKVRNHGKLDNTEFATEMTLPAGVWVGDYYLDMPDGRREMGILAEKKAVKWIYQQIVNVNRDPGILELKGTDKLSWRIFPFRSEEIRTSGIQFIHHEPLDFSLTSNKKLQIFPNKKAEEDKKGTIETDFAVYLPSHEKAKLPLVTRPAMYHFIVDNAGDTRQKTDFYITEIKKIAKKQGIKPQNAQIVLMNYRDETISMAKDWEASLKNRQPEGGFYVERALKKILSTNYLQKSPYQPIIILLSSPEKQAKIQASVANFPFIFQEIDKVYGWESTKNVFDIFSLRNEAGKQTTEKLAYPSTRAYPNAQKPLAYLPDNEQASVIIKTNNLPIDKLASLTQARSWLSGLHLYAAERGRDLYPQETQARWLAVVQASFRTQIQCNATSFIALENEAQKEALLAKQRQTLNAKHYLDTYDEQIRQMDEPSWIWYIVLAGVACFWYIKNTR